MKPPSRHEVVNALATERLLPFVMLVFGFLNPGKPPLKPSWYLQAMCYWLERVARGELTRSMIWIQPRALKSITCSVAFPCWLLGRSPSEEIMVATYGGDLSRQHAEHRRMVLESEWYQRLFPGTRISQRGNRQEEILTTQNGRILSISVGGRATGSGANFIILDDVMKTDEAQSEAARAGIKNWFDTTVQQRLNPFGMQAIVSIQQRVHEDDLPAYLREKGYDCLCLPAIAPRDMEIETGPGRTHLYARNDILCPELMSREALERKRIDSGPQVFAAQFLQDPVVPEGNLVRMDHFRRYEEPIDIMMFDKRYQSWDTASTASPTSSYSVCTTWGYIAGRLFLIDIYRQRVEYYQLKAAVIALRNKFRVDRVLMEDASAGIGLIQEFRKAGPFPLTRCRPTISKVERLIAQTGQIEEGRVWLPAQLPGLDDFLGELRAFPLGTHDDCVDSLSQMLEFSLDHWRDVATPYTPDGRRVRIIRENKRPPLPPLPDWIY